MEKTGPMLMSTINNLLAVLNEIVLQSRHTGLDEYLTQELLEAENTQLFVRTFAQWVLSPEMKDTISQLVPYSQLKLYRLNIIRHYRVRRAFSNFDSLAD